MEGATSEQQEEARLSQGKVTEALEICDEPILSGDDSLPSPKLHHGTGLINKSIKKANRMGQQERSKEGSTPKLKQRLISDFLISAPPTESRPSAPRPLEEARIIERDAAAAQVEEPQETVKVNEQTPPKESSPSNINLAQPQDLDPIDL